MKKLNINVYAKSRSGMYETLEMRVYAKPRLKGLLKVRGEAPSL